METALRVKQPGAPASSEMTLTNYSMALGHFALAVLMPVTALLGGYSLVVLLRIEWMPLAITLMLLPVPFVAQLFWAQCRDQILQLRIGHELVARSWWKTYRLPLADLQRVVFEHAKIVTVSASRKLPGVFVTAHLLATFVARDRVFTMKISPGEKARLLARVAEWRQAGASMAIEDLAPDVGSPDRAARGRHLWRTAGLWLSALAGIVTMVAVFQDVQQDPARDPVRKKRTAELVAEFASRQAAVHKWNVDWQPVKITAVEIASGAESTPARLRLRGEISNTSTEDIVGIAFNLTASHPKRRDPHVERLYVPMRIAVGEMRDLECVVMLSERYALQQLLREGAAIGSNDVVALPRRYAEGSATGADDSWSAFLLDAYLARTLERGQE